MNDTATMDHRAGQEWFRGKGRDLRPTWLITGGPGPEREGSLISGEDVATAFEALEVPFRIVDLIAISDAELEEGDTAFLTTHGQWGEDGKLQGYLETLRIAYTGAGVLGAAISMHKAFTNCAAEALGLVVPPWLHVTPETTPAQIDDFVHTHGSKVVLRPTTGGGSRGVVVAQTPADVTAALASSSWEPFDYLLNPYIDGTEVSAACIATNDEVEHLPTLQTEHDGPTYDYRIKHDQALPSIFRPAVLG